MWQGELAILHPLGPGKLLDEALREGSRGSLSLCMVTPERALVAEQAGNC